MDLAIDYIREAQSYLDKLVPEFHLDELLCESYEEDEVNESTINLFLESGNTDGDKRDDNKELKKKASSSLKAAIMRIIDVIKNFISNILNFFKELFQGRDSVSDIMKDTLDASEDISKIYGVKVKIEVEDKESLIKTAREYIKKLNSARKSRDPERIAAAKKQVEVAVKEIKGDKIKVKTITLEEALKSVEESENSTKRESVAVKKLQDELLILKRKLDEDDEKSSELYKDIADAEFEASALMQVAEEEQTGIKKKTTSFFTAIKSMRKLIKSNDSIERARAAAEVIDAASNNPRVNKFCRGVSKIGSVLFDKGSKDDSITNDIKRAKVAESEGKKLQSIGGYSTAINKALKNNTVMKVAGAAAVVGKTVTGTLTTLKDKTDAYVNDIDED